MRACDTIDYKSSIDNMAISSFECSKNVKSFVYSERYNYLCLQTKIFSFHYIHVTFTLNRTMNKNALFIAVLK